MTIYNSILIGVPVKSFDLAAASPADGQIYALPARASLLEWQFFFGTDPDDVEISIQTSLDAIHWNEVANSTSVTGDSGNFITAAKFIKAEIISITNGNEVTVIFNAAIPTQEYNITNNFPANMNGFVRQAYVELDNNDIKALVLSQSEIVAAPGVGKVIIPLRGIIRWHIVDDYTNVNSDAVLFFTMGDLRKISAIEAAADSGLSGYGPGDYVSQVTFGPSQVNYPTIIGDLTSDLVGYNLSGFENQPLNLVADNPFRTRGSFPYTGDGNFTGGGSDNNAKITVSYFILDIETGEFI